MKTYQIHVSNHLKHYKLFIHLLEELNYVSSKTLQYLFRRSISTGIFWILAGQFGRSGSNLLSIRTQNNTHQRRSQFVTLPSRSGLFVPPYPDTEELGPVGKVVAICPWCQQYLGHTSTGTVVVSI